MTELSAPPPPSRPAPAETPSVPGITNPVASVSEDVRTLLRDLLARLGPGAAFGQVVREGETAVIPVSEVRVGFGFGLGAGLDAERPESSGGGGGGGARGRVVPRGFVRLGAEGARFVPLTDPARIALTALAVLAASAVVTVALRQGR